MPPSQKETINADNENDPCSINSLFSIRIKQTTVQQLAGPPKLMALLLDGKAHLQLTHQGQALMYTLLFLLLRYM
jgi:hypothetical protein